MATLRPTEVMPQRFCTMQFNAVIGKAQQLKTVVLADATALHFLVQYLNNKPFEPIPCYVPSCQ
jgi:hypothetical protein